VTTRTRGFEGALEARKAITYAMGLYRKKFGGKAKSPQR
jgi:hypothetical protein